MCTQENISVLEAQTESNENIRRGCISASAKKTFFQTGDEEEDPVHTQDFLCHWRTLNHNVRKTKRSIYTELG